MMGVPVDLYLNALIILAIIGGVLGVGFKALNNHKKKE